MTGRRPDAPTDVLAFGLCLRSDLPFPGLPPGAGAPDATIALAPVAAPDAERLEPRAGEPLEASGRFVALGDEAYFQWPGFARVRVAGGRSVAVEPDAAVDPDQLRAALLGPVASVLLLQRGLLPLHAAALEVGGRAIAIAARSGAGKSTLVARLVARGHAFLSDDVTAVAPGAPPSVRASYPLLKLTPRSQALLGRAGEEAPLVDPLDEKRLFAVPGELPRGPRALERVYVLDDARGVEVARAAPAEALFLLLRHCHRAPLLHRAIGTAELTRRCAALAESVPVFRLGRPFDLARLDELASAVERHARERAA